MWRTVQRYSRSAIRQSPTTITLLFSIEILYTWGVGGFLERHEWSSPDSHEHLLCNNQTVQSTQVQFAIIRDANRKQLPGIGYRACNVSCPNEGKFWSDRRLSNPRTLLMLSSVSLHPGYIITLDPPLPHSDSKYLYPKWQITTFNFWSQAVGIKHKLLVRSLLIIEWHLKSQRSNLKIFERLISTDLVEIRDVSTEANLSHLFV